MNMVLLQMVANSQTRSVSSFAFWIFYLAITALICVGGYKLAIKFIAKVKRDVDKEMKKSGK